MFVPHGEPSPNSSPSSARRRRRRRVRNGGGPSSSGSAGSGERAESEVPTCDPCVDPEVVRLPEAREPPQQPAQLVNNPAGQQELLDVLRQLLTKKDSDDRSDWNSLKGPKPGTKWKGGAAPLPPTWKYDKDDIRAYSKFCKKVDIWKLQARSYMTGKEMALTLYTSLQGELEQELEHLEVSEFYKDDGVEVLLACLKQPMEQKLVYQKRRFLHEFEVLRRMTGETMRA